jgi:hypothetical protein
MTPHMLMCVTEMVRGLEERANRAKQQAASFDNETKAKQQAASFDNQTKAEQQAASFDDQTRA